jgi:hypothetical protein
MHQSELPPRGRPANRLGKSVICLFKPLGRIVAASTMASAIVLVPGVSSKVTAQTFVSDAAAIRARAPLSGKPCISVVGSSKAHVSNATVFDHIVATTNTCSQTIKLKICYYKSTHCVDVSAAGKTTKDVILGSFPSVRDFRFSVTESKQGAIF